MAENDTRFRLEGALTNGILPGKDLRAMLGYINLLG
jgi:hypothetical protein